MTENTISMTLMQFSAYTSENLSHKTGQNDPTRQMRSFGNSFKDTHALNTCHSEPRDIPIALLSTRSFIHHEIAAVLLTRRI